MFSQFSTESIPKYSKYTNLRPKDQLGLDTPSSAQFGAKRFTEYDWIFWCACAWP